MHIRRGKKRDVADTCTTWQVIAACAISKSPTTAKLLNATNARSKSMVNSSQHHQTRWSTHHTILQRDEWTMLRVDCLPSWLNFELYPVGLSNIYGNFTTTQFAFLFNGKTTEHTLYVRIITLVSEMNNSMTKGFHIYYGCVLKHIIFLKIWCWERQVSNHNHLGKIRERKFPGMKGLGNEIFIYRNEKSNERKFLGMKSLGIESSFLGTKGLGHEKSASPRQYLTTLFLQAGCPSCHSSNSIKALKALLLNNKVDLSSQGVASRYVRLWFACVLLQWLMLSMPERIR